MTEQQKRNLMARAEDMGITLNGKPARVLGAKLDFATVACCPQGESYQWTWEAIGRILDKGGKFSS